ncbi:MCE family protein [Mycolicibacter longobardus]|uniref:Mammalian cell entry protein n=1 Tax=Mycolicibacter longobardus TaxID=1108812 RepID=A0A1X1YAF7_9MYCO|nr:MCE family protein [Mycolicibacter longobardus]ORW08102.1 mammalian cell entry protein [Mycolicibacter longobardus]
MSATIRTVRDRPLESYPPLWVGVIALSLVVVLLAGLLIGRSAGAGYTHYQADFLQAAQLRAGDNVTVAGVSVGEVQRVSLAGTKVVVDLRVRSDVPLGSQTRAAIKLTTLLGSRYLELRPAGPNRLQNNRIGMSYTEVPYDLQALLADATTTVETLDTAQMASAMGVLANQLDGLPAALPPAMTNLRTLSEIIADRRDQIGALLEATQTITSTLQRQQAGLGQLVYQGRDLLGEFVSRRAAFSQMMAALTRIVDLLSRAVGPDRAAFEEMLVSMRDLTAMISEHDDLFRNLLQALPLPIRNITNATGYSPSLEFNLTNGLLVDDWMCAISGRAKQFHMIEYFKDCA